MHKEVRKAVDRAVRAGLQVSGNAGRSSHTWGWIACPCGKRIPVYSTGRNAEKGARLIRGFVNKHEEHA